MTGNERWRIRVTGTVQGVGFRPFVYRVATGLGLAGWVRNDSQGVLIEAEGDAGLLDRLVTVVTEDPPRSARVTGVVVTTLGPPTGDEGFAIAPTEDVGPPTAPVAVDTATCDACLAEVRDPTDRRHRYPFTNCTDCGPRYTIVRSVPYDRPSTTMAAFAMCDACQAEYDNPADRRYHAQPNACADCGPRLSWRRPDGTARSTGDDALLAAAAALRDGAIVAVKGLGGYHLAVDADSPDAVAELRRRKHRDDKPFAIMVPSVDVARELADLDAAAVAALTSPARPVVIAPMRGGPRGARCPAPDRSGFAGREGDDGAVGGPSLLVEVGVFLPYSPLHHLLLAEVGRPLVMTSGNLNDEPIAHADDDAVARLGPLVDGLLTHDRPIHIRCDDSVVRSSPRRTQVLRRSRGLAPEPFRLPVATTQPILAMGAELKATVAVARGGFVMASHHLGDLEHLATYEAYRQAIDHLCHLYDVAPEVVAHDLHPEYLSTKLAVDLDLPLVGVQHHHAHVASCLVEHGRTDPVVALAFDGTGYGTDGTLWGGEVLVADLTGFERVGHLRPIAMPGGGAAIREPWRMALAWTTAAGCPGAVAPPDVAPATLAGVGSLVAAGHGPVTTSVGRLFDALAAVVTGRAVATYEAQAAIELEALARRVDVADAPFWAETSVVDLSGTVAQLDPRPLVARVVAEVDRGTAPELVAAGVHRSIGEAAAALAAETAAARGIDTVVLTGGAFQNVRLTDVVEDVLGASGVHVLVHHCVPANDGGISIGQAAVAAVATVPATRSRHGTAPPRLAARPGPGVD
ncbi:MAG: carbamoyltransferase HypF [Acidimicrobiales bacterium]